MHIGVRSAERASSTLCWFQRRLDATATALAHLAFTRVTAFRCKRLADTRPVADKVARTDTRMPTCLYTPAALLSTVDPTVLEPASMLALNMSHIATRLLTGGTCMDIDARKAILRRTCYRNHP